MLPTIAMAAQSPSRDCEKFLKVGTDDHPITLIAIDQPAASRSAAGGRGPRVSFDRKHR